MDKSPKITHFRRYHGYDYSRGAVEFVTFHLERRIPTFGTITQDGKMILSQAGKILEEVILHEGERDSMIDLIALKAKEGVDVKILMPHIPDKKAPFYMGRANYRKILLAGGSICEMTRGFNHAKNIIVDDKYAFIGTVNMDYRSLFLHYECGALIIKSPELIKMREDFDNEVKDSVFITYEMWKKRPLRQKLIAYFLNLFAPMF